MQTDNNIKVEVAYALPAEQVIIGLEVPAGSDARYAIEQSGILQRFPQIDLIKDKIGVFSKICKLERVLEAGDRVEIYRPLLIDPKEKRRKRAADKDKAKDSDEKKS